MKALSVKNGACVALIDIPLLSYDDFYAEIVEALSDINLHCVNYFAYPQSDSLRLYACLADDAQGDIHILSCEVAKDAQLPAISAKVHAMERFERELNENHGLRFLDHPWMKPVRYAHDRADKTQVMDNYPFYSIKGENLHEVGVGPIHAGIIEPGHFRFICDGEKVLHLEIHLGYQHRDVENLMLQKDKLIQRSLLAESTAGDTAVGHGTAFAMLWESLCGVEVSKRTQLERTLAAEIERIAIHTGDLSALCGDVAYQLGNAVFGRLRTPIINFMQEWCGNRLGKGCIRPGHSPYVFTPALADRLQVVLQAYERDYLEMIAKTLTMPSVLARFERTGVLSREQAVEIGAVGMAARASELARDIRSSHPYLAYPLLHHESITRRHGDVYSRTQIRRYEIVQSMTYARQLAQQLKNMPLEDNARPEMKPQANCFSIMLTEGWRGEICHCAITDAEGKLACYKIKDPSFHNWMALALAVRGNEISDFPICNKSFNLSYCGHDL